MEFYRFLFLGELGSSVSEERLRCVDDGEALELARLLANPLGVEVWQGKRRVGIALSDRLSKAG